MKAFYCPYCNRMRSGARGTDGERTDEHFIPQSVGGTWRIKVCRKCNNHAGATCDQILKRASYTYTLFANGTADIEGVAEMKDGREILAHFRYQAAARHHQYHFCRRLDDHTEIPRDEIKFLAFPSISMKDTRDTAPAIAKIALASAYYLVRRHLGWFEPQKGLFEGLVFADLRKVFLSDFAPGGIGSGHGARLEVVEGARAFKELKMRQSQRVRRHLVSIEDSDEGIRIVVCLYSYYYWVVVIPGAKYGMRRLEEEAMLSYLEPIDETKIRTINPSSAIPTIKIIVH